MESDSQSYCLSPGKARRVILVHDSYSYCLSLGKARRVITRRAGVFPMESNTKTIAKRARVGPRTQIVLTMKMLFLIRISSISGRGSDMIVLDNVLKIWIELIKQRNDNAREKFYRVQWFRKVDIFGRNFENFENSRKNHKFIEGCAPALRVIRAGTRLTVHRSLPYGNNS